MVNPEESEHWSLIASGQWDVLEAVLCDLALLEAKVAAGQVFALAEDFVCALTVLPKARPGRRLVALLSRAVRREAWFLSRHPGAFFQCIFNLAWWHEELRTLLESRWREKQRDPTFTWVRSLRAPIVPLDSELAGIFPLPESVESIPLCCSLDGERIAVFFTSRKEGKQPSAPLLWDVTTGQPLDIIPGSLPPLRVSNVSPDGRWRVRSGSWSDPVHILDANTGEAICSLQKDGDSILDAFAFSPNGKLLAAAGYGDEYIGLLLVWDVNDGRTLLSLTLNGCVWSVAFSPDGRWLACGTSDNIEIRDAASGTLIRTLPGHEDTIWAVAFSPDGKFLASASGSSVRLWEVDYPAAITSSPPHPDHVQDLVFSTDGKRLVSRSTNDTMWLWDAKTGTSVASLHASAGVVLMGGSAHGSVFADHRRVVSVAAHGGMWDPATGASLGEVPQTLRFYSSSRIAFSPDGRLLAVASGYSENELTLFDTATWGIRRQFGGTGDEVRVLAFSPDGRSIAMGTMSGRVWVWSVEGETHATLVGHENFTTAVAFSSDGRLVVSSATDATVRVWDARKGTQLACLAPADIGEWGRETSWSEGKKTTEVIHRAAHAVAFAPDGTIVTLTNAGKLHWWDWRSGTCTNQTQGAGDFRAIAAGLPFRALMRNGEVVIETAAGEAVAWLACEPVMEYRGGFWLNLKTHPGGRIWAGAAAGHLYHFALEGAPHVRLSPQATNTDHESYEYNE